MFDRYIGELNDEQIVVFREFKSWIEREHRNAAENPWFTDLFLIRFCRARKFDQKKVEDMFGDYMNYRKDNEIDTIYNVSK